jgi:hypothetical protein
VSLLEEPNDLRKNGAEILLVCDIARRRHGGFVRHDNIEAGTTVMYWPYDPEAV